MQYGREVLGFPAVLSSVVSTALCHSNGGHLPVMTSSRTHFFPKAPEAQDDTPFRE